MYTSEIQYIHMIIASIGLKKKKKNINISRLFKKNELWCTFLTTIKKDKRVFYMIYMITLQ